MRRMFLSYALVLVMILCTACGQVPEPEPITEPEPVTLPVVATQPTEHACDSICKLCGACTDAQCAETACSGKCPGVHREEVYQFPDGDYITDRAVSVDTGTLVFDIGKNVYVPGNLDGMAESLVIALEKVSGLDFDGAGYAQSAFSDGKVHVNVSRDLLYAGIPEHSWYTGLQTSEQGSAYASSGTHVALSPGDLFVGNSYAIAHELGHMLMYRQSEWAHSQLLDEGFAEYTTYLVLKELEETVPETAVYLEQSTYTITNVEIYDYGKLYEQPLEYWFENSFEYSGNGNYAVGFRFMNYLHDVYGDYSKWICAFEEMYSFRQRNGYSDQSSVEQQIEVLKTAYGADVLDGFYPWLKENLARFDPAEFSTGYTDRTAVEKINLYPVFTRLNPEQNWDVLNAVIFTSIWSLCANTSANTNSVMQRILR